MLPLIKNTNEGQAIEFEAKCEAFLQAMYPKPPITPIDANIAENWESQKWPNTKAGEVENAIFISSSKKTPRLDCVTFLILQKVYEIVPELFHVVFITIIDARYYPKC